ncbi:MAG TPA: outer membrane protein assembly factor BamE [Planctomycetota bacterium]|nr:outer membrane protein assembly factor BamE [Planctomycetota bacterium]
MKWSIALWVLLPGLTSGCLLLGRQQQDHRIDAERLTQVKKGMSKEEVTGLLGAPQEILFSNKEHDPLREHAYIFEHATTQYTGIVFLFMNFGNSDEKRDRAIVFFDEVGKVDHVGASLRAESARYGFPFGQ